MAHAVRKRQKEGKPLDGEFGRAQQYLQDYHRWAFRLQNPDGSFSTQWLEYRESRPDIERRLQTSGHIFEWLAFSLSEEELRQPDAVRAVDYLTTLLSSRRERNWSIGPLGHGLHALALYDERGLPPVGGEATGHRGERSGSSAAARRAAPQRRQQPAATTPPWSVA